MSVQAMAWVFDHERTTSGTDRLVLLSIANHAGATLVDGAFEAYPSIDTIGVEAGSDRRQTIKDALGRLEAAGLIERKVNAAPDNRIRIDRRPNLYRIIVSGGTESVLPNDRERGLAFRASGGSSSVETGAREASPKPSLKPPMEPKDLSRDALSQFELFWLAYPRKTAKGSARKAWPKATAKATATQIIEAAERFARDPNRDDRFTPHPATWLNQERWLDGPLPRRTQSPADVVTSARVSTDRTAPSGRVRL